MSKPEKTFRLGSVSASVFLNTDGQDRPFRTVSLQRRYKDGDEWKTSNSFTAGQAPAAVAVLQLALHYMVAQDEAEAGE